MQMNFRYGNTLASLLVAIAVIAIVIWMLPGQSQDRNLDSEKSTSPDTSASEIDDFENRLLQIAKIYQGYGRVDDETRWAPWLCRMPMPSVARFSNSKDEATHGEKLYFLFARKRDSYGKLLTDLAETKPIGQVLVKESWLPKEVNQAAANQVIQDLVGLNQESPS